MMMSSNNNIVITAGQVLDSGDCGNGNIIGTSTFSHKYSPGRYAVDVVDNRSGGVGADDVDDDAISTQFPYCDSGYATTITTNATDCAHSTYDDETANVGGVGGGHQLTPADSSDAADDGAMTDIKLPAPPQPPQPPPNGIPASASTATVIPLQKQNLMSTYLHRIFNHCKVNIFFYKFLIALYGMFFSLLYTYI